MSNSVLLNKKNNGRKVFSLFKYLVLIFAFMFVGVVGAHEDVRAYDIYVNETANQIEFSFGPPEGGMGVDDISAVVCDYGTESNCKTILTVGDIACGTGDLIFHRGSTKIGYRCGGMWLNEDKFALSDTFNNLVESNSKWVTSGFRIGIKWYGGTPKRWGFDYLDTNFFTEPVVTIDSSTSGSIKQSHNATISATAANGVKFTSYVWAPVWCSSYNYNWGNYTITRTGCEDGVDRPTAEGSSTGLSGENGKWYLYGCAMDNYGNAKCTNKSFNLDNAAPALGDFNPNGSSEWSNSTSVKITASDTGAAGVDKVYYCWTKSSCSSSDYKSTSSTSFSTTPTIEGSDLYLWAYVVDKAGNGSSTTTIKKSNSFKYDKTAPSITINNFANKGSSYNISVSVVDTLSNVKTKQYCISTSESDDDCVDGWRDLGSTIKTDDHALEDGKYYIIVKAVDNAGNDNRVVSTNQINLDQTAANFTMEHKDCTANVCYANNASSHVIILKSDDTDDGEQKVTYYWGKDGNSSQRLGQQTNQVLDPVNGITVTMPSSFADGNYILYAQVIDGSGNVSETYSNAPECVLDTQEITVTKGNDLKVYKYGDSNATHAGELGGTKVMGQTLEGMVTFTLNDANLVVNEVSSSNIADYVSFSSTSGKASCSGKIEFAGMTGTLYFWNCSSENENDKMDVKLRANTNGFKDKAGNTITADTILCTVYIDSVQEVPKIELADPSKTAYVTGETVYINVTIEDGYILEAGSVKTEYPTLQYKVGDDAKNATFSSELVSGTTLQYSIRVTDEIMTNGFSIVGLDMTSYSSKTSNKLVDKGGNVFAGGTQDLPSIGSNDADLGTSGITVQLSTNSSFSPLFNIGGGSTVYASKDLYVRFVMTFSVYVGAGGSYEGKYTINSGLIKIGDTALSYTAGAVITNSSESGGYMNVTQYIVCGVLGSGVSSGTLTIQDGLITSTVASSLTSSANNSTGITFEIDNNSENIFSGSHYAKDGVAEITPTLKGDYYYDASGTKISGCNFLKGSVTCKVTSGELTISGLAKGANTIEVATVYNKYGVISASDITIGSTNSSDIKISAELATGSEYEYITQDGPESNDTTTFYYFVEHNPKQNITMTVDAGLKYRLTVTFAEGVEDEITSVTQTYDSQSDESTSSSPTIYPLGGVTYSVINNSARKLIEYKIIFRSKIEKNVQVNVIKYDSSLLTLEVDPYGVSGCNTASTESGTATCTLSGIYGKNVGFKLIAKDGNADAVYASSVLEDFDDEKLQSKLSNLTGIKVTSDVDGVVKGTVEFSAYLNSLSFINRPSIVDTIEYGGSFKSITGVAIVDVGDVRREIEVTYINSAPSYIPLVDNDVDGDQFTFSCQSNNYCFIDVSEDPHKEKGLPGTEMRPAYFVSITNNDKDSSAYKITNADDHIITQFSPFTFVYTSDNEAPKINSIRGPLDSTSCENSIPSLIIHDSMCFIIEIEDDADGGIVLDKELITVGQEFKVTEFKLIEDQRELVDEANGIYKHKIRLIVKYYQDTEAAMHTLTDERIVITAKAITDLFRASLNVASDKVFDITLIPNGLNLREAVILGKGVDGYYNDYSVQITFNKAIATFSAFEVYAKANGEDYPFTCGQSGSSLICEKPSTLTAEGTHEIYVKGEITDNENVSLSFSDRKVTSLIYDTTGPSIVLDSNKTTGGEFDTEHGFEIGVVASDTGVGIDLNSVIQGIPTVKAGENVCTGVKIRYENGIHIISVGKCPGEGEISVEFSSWVKDKLGNTFAGSKISGTGVTVGSGEMDLVGDPAYTAGALKANETREIRFTFTEEIVTLNCLAIEIITGNATITGCKKDLEDSKILVLTIQAKYGGVGTISLVIGSGAVAYENDTKTVVYKFAGRKFSLDLEILSGNYNIGFDGITQTGCNGYYCGVGSTLTFNFTANRDIISTGTTNNMTLTIGGVTKSPITAVISGNSIRFTYTVVDGDNGQMSLSNILLGAKDLAGNAGSLGSQDNYALSVEMMKYQIITSAAAFDGETIARTVFVGSSFATFKETIEKTYNLSAYFSHEFEWNDEATLVNGDLFAELGEFVITMTATDAAGNDSVLTINLTIDFGGEIKVTLKDKSHIFDTKGYSYDGESEIIVELPSLVANMDKSFMSNVFLNKIKSQFNSSNVGIEDVTGNNGKNVGEYVIKTTLESITLKAEDKAVLVGTFALETVNGVYTVKKQGLAINIDNCKVPVRELVYTGDPNIDTNYRFKCGKVELIGASVTVANTNVGTTTYTISGISVSEGDSTNYEVSGSGILTGTAIISPKQIDLTNHVFEEINKYYDGDKSVAVSKGTFASLNDTRGQSITISWTSGEYDIGDSWASGEVVVKLYGAQVISTTNYTIKPVAGKEYVLAKGTLLKDGSFGYTVGYYKGSSKANVVNYVEGIYSNESVTFKVTNYYGNVVSSYKGADPSELFEHKWRVCTQQIDLESPAWAMCTLVEDEANEYTMSQTGWLYLEVKDPSGNVIVKEMRLDYNNTGIILNSIYLSDYEEADITKEMPKSKTANVYRLDEVIVVVLGFDRNIKTASETLVLEGTFGSYTFRLLEIQNNLVAYAYQVASKDESDVDVVIKVSALEALNNKMLDYYGNTYKYDSASNSKIDFDEDEDGTYSIEIDREPADIEGIYFNIEGVTDIVGNTYYVDTKKAANKTLTVTFVFSVGGIKVYPTIVTINTDISLNCVVGGENNEKLICSKLLYTSDISDKDGKLTITKFNEKKMAFENRTIELLVSEMSSYVKESIYVDNEVFKYRLSTTETKIRDSAVIKYECSKDRKTADCLLSANDLDVKLGNVDVAKSNIEVDDDTITITGLSTMNIAEGELVVKLGTSKKDFVGNTATSNTIVLSADNSALGVSTIQSIGCQDCGLNGILKVVITFNKPVAEVDGVEINTNDADIKLSYLLVEGNQVQFVYSVTKTNIEKTIQLVSFSSNKIMDALGNVLDASELDLTDDSVSGNMRIDTKAPELDSITSEAVGCTNSVCTTSGRVNVKLHFNEEVEEYDNLRIETNFGIFEHLMSAIVKSQVVVITVEVDDSIEDKLNSFIVTKITGNFYDKADNKLLVSGDGEVHKNTNITLDSAIPRVESVVIADAIASNEVSGVKYYKSGDVFTVTVTFTDPIANVNELLNNVRLEMYFDKAAGGTWSKAVANSNKSIVFTYTVSPSDNGQLGSNMKLIANGLKDAAGNVLDTVLPEYDRNVIVDNIDLEIKLSNAGENDKGSSTAVIRYECNKAYVNCALTTSMFVVEKNSGGTSTALNVTVVLGTDGDGFKTATITGLTGITATDIVIVKIAANSIFDYTGRGNKASSVNVEKDTSAMEILYSYGIEVKANSTSDCASGICKVGDKFKIVIPFNKTIKEYSNGIYLSMTVGGVAREAKFSSQRTNFLEFEYTVQSGDNGEIRIVSINGSGDYLVKDNLGNENAEKPIFIRDGYQVIDDYVVDTRAPQLLEENYITSVARDCDVNGYCTTGNKVRVSLYFDEEIHKYKNLVIVTNFGTFDGTGTTQVIESDIVNIDIVISAKNVSFDKFVVTKVVGEFYDKYDNVANVEKESYKDALDHEINVHENENIKLDTEVPTITSVVVSGCNEVDGVSYCKGGDEIIVEVTFNEALENTEASKNRPKLSIMFDNVGRGDITSTVSADKRVITYTYVVSASDAGELSSLELTGGYLTDVVGNAARVEIDEESLNAVKVVADNVKAKVNKVVLKKDNKEIKANVFVKASDVLVINVVFEEPVSGVPTLYVKDAEGNVLYEINGIVEDDASITYEYVVGAEAGVVSLVLEGEVFDRALNEAELPYEYKTYSINVVKGGNELVFVREKEVVATADISVNRILIYTIEQNNELTFDDTYNKIKDQFKLLCRISGETDFLEVCKSNGYTITEIPLTVAVEKGEGVYNVYWNTNSLHTSYDLYLIELKLVFNGSGLKDLAGNDISVTVDEEGNDVVVYDNIKRSLKTFEFTTESSVGARYYVREGSTINVSLEFNAPLANGLGENDRYPLIVRLNKAITVELETDDGVTYTGSYVYDGVTPLCANEGKECILSAAVMSRDAASGRTIATVKGSNNVVYTIEEETNSNLYVDNIAPVVTISHNHANNIVGNNIIAKFECVDNAGSKYASGCDKITVTVNGEEYTADGNGQYNIDISSIESEKVTVSFTGTDKLGNSRSDTYEFTVDHNAPTMKINDENISAPIASGGNYVVVEVTDHQSNLAKNAEIQYRWVKVGEAEGEWKFATLVNGKVNIAVPLDDGVYTLSVTGATDSLGNVNTEVVTSKEITIDNTAPEIGEFVLEAAKCLTDEETGIIYCGKYDTEYSIIRVTVTFDDTSVLEVTKVESLYFETIQQTLSGNVLSFGLRVKSDVVTNKENMEVLISVRDALGFNKDHTVALENVKIDVEDNVRVNFELDNEVGKKGTKISVLDIIDESGYAPVNKVTCELSDGSSCYIGTIMNKEFNENVTLTIRYQDMVGNGSSQEFEIEIDNEEARAKYEVVDNSMVAEADRNDVIRVFNKSVTIKLSEFSEKAKYRISFCDETYLNCELKHEASEYGQEEVNKVIDMVNDYEYVLIEIEDQGLNVVTYEFALKYVEPVVERGEDVWAQSHILTVAGHEDYSKITYKVSKGLQAGAPVLMSNGVAVIDGKNAGYNGEYTVTVVAYISNNHYKELEAFTLKFDNEINLNNFTVNYFDKTGQAYNENWTNGNVMIEISEIEEDESTELSGLKRVVVGDKECAIGEDKVVCTIEEYNKYTITIEDNAGNIVKIRDKEIKIDKEGFEIDISTLESKFAKRHDVVFNFIGVAGAPFVKSLWLLVPQNGEIDISEVDASTFNNFYLQYMYDLPKGQGDNPNKLAMTVGNDELNGLYHLFVYTIDEAGNEELLRSLLMFDNAGPEIDVEISEDYAKYEIDANGDLYDVTNARKVANFVDEHVDRDEASNIVVTYTFMKDGKAVLMDELQGEYVLVIEAKDSLGNTSRKEANVKVDNIGPNVVLENNGTNSNPVFTVTDINGVDWESIQYCISLSYKICDEFDINDDFTYNTETNRLTIELNNTNLIGNIGIRVRILDNLTNVSDEVFNLYYDSIAPVIEVTGVRKNDGTSMRIDNTNDLYTTIVDFTNRYIYIDIEIDDYSFDGNTRGVLKVCFGNHMIENIKAFDACGSVEISKSLSKDEESGKYKVSYLVRENGYLNIYVEDRVGNHTIKRVHVSNISDAAPDFSLSVDNSPSQTKVVDIVIKGDLEDITSVEYKVLPFDTKYTSVSKIYEEAENAIAVSKDKLNIENAENNLYVVKVTNKWGNSSYRAIRVNSLDKSAPTYNEGKDFELSINGGKLLKEEYDNGTLKGYEVVTQIAASGNKFVYNAGDIKLVFPGSAVYEEILNGYELGQKVFIEICYNGTCAPLVDVSVDTNGNSVGSAKSLNELFGLEEFVGTITYQIKDEAGNLGELRSFYIERNAAVESTISTTVNNKAGWLNAYNVTYTSVTNGLLIDKVEYYFVDTEGNTYCVNELEAGVEENIACVNLDGLYTLKYRITDKLGYVEENIVSIEGSQLNNIPLDTIAPLNTDKEVATFGLHKENSNYYIRYNIVKEGIEENASMQILYSDETLYCVVVDAHKVSSGDCDLVDINKFDGTKLHFKTKIVDKAGNVSVTTQEYELEYNESRSVTVGNAKYDGTTKTITIDIIVNNPTEKVNRFVVSVENGTNNWVESSDLATSITGANNRYKLQITPANFATLFSGGFINKKIQIKVFDNYAVDEGLELGQMGQPAVVDVNFDTNDPDITINVANQIIKTDAQENTFTYLVNNKESAKIAKVQYIIQRTSNVAALATITKDNFTTEYLDCKYCAASGVVSENSITMVSDSTLETGTYRLIVYVEDVYGNKQIASKTLNIDNTKPVFKIVNTNNIDNYVQKGEHKVYKETIKVYALDNVSKFYNSDVKSFVVINVKTTVETPINLEQEFITMGGRNSNFADGEYMLRVEDVAGNVRVQKIIVDTENDGFGLVSSDDVDTADRVFNLDGLDKLSVVLYEEMSYMRFEFMVGSSRKIWFEVDENGCRFTLDNNQTRSCAGTWDDVIKFGLNDSIRIKDVLDLAEGYTLNTNINKLYIRADNVSGIKAERDIALDFSVPTIVVNRSIKGKMLEVLGEIVNEEAGIKIACKDIAGKVVYDCRKYDTKVETRTGQEYAPAIKEIITAYIKSVDSKSYSAVVNDSDRLIINYYNINDPENKKTIYTSENDWEYFTYILKEVGEYVVEYTYKDAAGNEAKPAYLVINVVDNEGPTVVNENNIKNSNNLYINDAKGSEYTVLSVKATDAYGFDAAGTIKEKKFYDFDLMMLKEDGTKVKVEFVLEGNAYVGRVDGIKYVVKATDMSGNVRYTFIKQAQYELVYNVYDYVGNAPKSIFKTTIDVFDKHAPNVIDSNSIVITENIYLTIDGELYTIIDEGNEVKLVDSLGAVIEVNNNIFEIEGERFELDRDAAKVYRVLNIDSSKVCFRGGEACAIGLEEITSYDVEDEENKIVDISEITYSRLGTTYTAAKANVDYVIVPVEEDAGLVKFRVKNISFALVGYYRVTFYSVDSSNNRSEVTYTIKVEDTEAPIFMKEGVEVGENFVKEQEYDEEFATEIRGAKYPGATEEEKVAKYIEAWVKANITLQHNYVKDANIEYTIEEIRLLAELSGQEYLKYSVILRAEDSSNNVSRLEFVYKIMDTKVPENGEVEISFDGMTVTETAGSMEYDTNAESIYFRLSGASDITNNVKYEYQVWIDGIEPKLWNNYNGGFELGYTSFVGEVRTVQIVYRAKDKVGNTSAVSSSSLMRVDTKAPVMIVETLDETENVEVADGEIYQGSGRIRITFRDDKGRMDVLGYRNNKKIRDTSFTSDDTVELSGFGHYKFIVKDPAGNEVVREFIIMPADNTFSVIDNTLLNDAMNAAEESKQFDMVILQKISQDGNSFYFEDMSLIGDKDNVFLMGVVPDREGSIFSIYASGAIGGSVFKQYTDYFPLNISSNVKNTNKEYTLADYVINYKGEKYILIGIEKDGYDGPTLDQQKENATKGGADFTWVFFVLGGAGAIGGVFLIMKLRKRVRAA